MIISIMNKWCLESLKMRLFLKNQWKIMGVRTWTSELEKAIPDETSRRVYTELYYDPCPRIERADEPVGESYYLLKSKYRLLLCLSDCVNHIKERPSMTHVWVVRAFGEIRHIRRDRKLYMNPKRLCGK